MESYCIDARVRRMPSPGRRVPRFLFALFVWREPGLADLANGLHRHQGSLRWTGAFSWPSPSWRRGLSTALSSMAGKRAFSEEGPRSPYLLPSEERSVKHCVDHLRAWLDATSSWQLSVPGDPFWEDRALTAWRAALKRLIARLLMFVWSASITLSRLEAAFVRCLRRLSFTIDSRREIR